MTASHTTRVSSDNSVSQSESSKTDPLTPRVVQIPHQLDEATSSTDVDSTVDRLGEVTTESQTWQQDSADEYLIDESVSTRTLQSRRKATLTTEAI